MLSGTKDPSLTVYQVHFDLFLLCPYDKCFHIGLYVLNLSTNENLIRMLKVLGVFWT